MTRITRKEISEAYANKIGRQNTAEFYKSICGMMFFYPLVDDKNIRLVHKGKKLLSKIYTFYDVETSYHMNDIPTKHYLFLSNYCNMPYYIGNFYISFSDENEAFTFKLCDGDLDNLEEISK